jgi:hypothetical protein
MTNEAEKAIGTSEQDRDNSPLGRQCQTTIPALAA